MPSSIGHGRVGQVVCAMLDRHQFHYSPSTTTRPPFRSNAGKGRTVYYGDATNPEFLKSCGLMDAAAVIVTIDETEGIDEIVAQVRALRQDILIVSRARDAAHARHLYQIGVTDAVPETIEASLLFSEAALIGLGVADGTGHRLDPREARRIPPRTAAGRRRYPACRRDDRWQTETVSLITAGGTAPELRAPCSSPAG